MADSSQILGIPQHIRNDQSSQMQRKATKLNPYSIKPFQREKNNNIRVSLSSSTESVNTEAGSHIIVSRQATCKQHRRLRVKGQSGSKIQRNADIDPSGDPCEAQRDSKYRVDHANAKHNDLISQSHQTNQQCKLILRPKGQRTQNTTIKSLSLGMSHLDKQERFNRQTIYKHLSSCSASATDSGSDQLELSSSSDGEVCSPTFPRGNIINTKRRKRVKRKGFSKSIDSHDEHNTTDGESATDTRVHDRRSRRREEESSLNSSTRHASRSKPSLSTTATNTIKGAQFRSSSLTSVSSAESGQLTSAISSPLLTPRGTTLVKKIQIQSFSSNYSGLKKDSKENLPTRKSSTEGYFSPRSGERSLIPGQSRSSKKNFERTDSDGNTSPLKGRPFGIRSKPFQLKRSSSKESPYTSEAESPSTSCSPGTKDENASFNAIPVFTGKPSHTVPLCEPFSLRSNNRATGLDDKLFGEDLTESNQGSNIDELPVFKSDIELEKGQVVPTNKEQTCIRSDVPLECSQWLDQCMSYDDNGPFIARYGYKSLSIVNESDEIDPSQPSTSDENIHPRNDITISMNNTFVSSDTWNLSTLDSEKDENRRGNIFDSPISPVRRPSYIKAQQNFDDFTQSLFHSFDDQMINPTLVEINLNSPGDNEFLENYDPKEVLRSFSGANLVETNTLKAIQKDADLIIFDGELALQDSTGEPVKKRKKKITRPKIPTILSVDGKEIVERLRDGNDKEYPAVTTREETMGQDSMDEKYDTISLTREEEFDVNGGSNGNALVAIDRDEGSTPRNRYSPQPDSFSIKDARTNQEKDKRNFVLPEITTGLYIDDYQSIISHDIPIPKVDTIYDTSEEDSQLREGDSSNGQINDQCSMETSGDLNVSGEITTKDKNRLSRDKNDGWRSHSDPSGRSNGAGASLGEAIVEVADLTHYRTNNNTVNLVSEKMTNEETMSNCSSLPMQTIRTVEKGRSKDDTHATLNSTSNRYPIEMLKLSPKVQSAPTTPIQPRKQVFPGTLSAEKAQMKLAKLAVAAMEPIYETPLTEVVRPLPEPVKLERKVGTSPISVTKETERPPVTGLIDNRPTPDKLQPKAKSKHDIKRHVVQNLLETEQSYVQNLQFIISAYYKPLKNPENSHIVDPAQVDEMFYQISDILLCHEFFLEQLEGRVNDWHDKQKIGDILVASFTKCFLMDAYSAFISHFLHARAAVRIATVSRPAFQRFIEQCCRDHREKYTLQDLMIIPVQRIPRYVLILKDMIKHTSQDHPDYGNLLLALGEIKTLADRMNRGEKEVNEAEIEADRLRDVEASIEGMTELVLPNRRFLRKDLAAEVRGSITKKDRCLFLFSDLLVCASVKRKPNALRRGSLSLFSGQSGNELNKHKLLWKMSLEHVELVKSSPEMQRRNSLERQLEKLENDMSVLSQISSLTDSLNVGHQTLDSSIREMMNEVSRQIAEKQIPMHQSLNTKVELQVQTEDGLENFVFLLLDVEIKNTWEAYFQNAKQKLAYAKDTFPPDFQYPIPITKTRSGMQFTCSSPSQVPHMLDRGNHCGSGDVWVCNSDGYVGQVCILSMEEQIQPVASLSVCSSRILCISPVPGNKLVGLENSDHDSKSDTRSLGNNSDTLYKVSSSQKISQGYSSDDDRNAQTIMAFDSSSDDEDANEAFITSKFGCNSPIFDGRLSPEGSSLGTIDGEMGSSNDDESEIEESEDEEKVKDSQRHIRRRDSALTTCSATSADDKLSLSDIVAYDTEEESTMWLGTEDGSIFVYSSNDSHQKKNKMKIQHQASVQCVLYVDNQVFVSLGNGDLCIYRRQPGSAWEVGIPITLQVCASAPVSCMTAVHGRLWCGCQCNAIIYNTTTLKIETQFNCSRDKDRSVYRMVSTGMGVWLSLQSSAVIRLFHATRYECLADVDVAPPVHKMLAGSDAIIRQHKAACLRVTSLLTCKDLLWIGTSAGVVLTLSLPIITASTSSLRNIPSATASYHGHTGHVRFLTAVEVPREGAQEVSSDNKESSTPLNNSIPSSRSPLTPGGLGGNSIARAILIISGGDGYEDFKTSSTSETAGRDDSTNHLLIWRV